MPLAREIRRARILQRRLQEKRNAEAQAEEAARQAALPGGVKMERTRAPKNKMLADPVGEDKVEAPPFSPLLYAEATVPFASERARELAAELELGARQFAGQSQSGRSGFTAGDVRRIAEENKR